MVLLMMFRAEELQTRARLSTLSESERRIVGLIVSGCTDAEVAERLFLCPKAVEWSLAKVCRKLNVRSRAELKAERGLGSRLQFGSSSPGCHPEVEPKNGGEAS